MAVFHRQQNASAQLLPDAHQLVAEGLAPPVQGEQGSAPDLLATELGRILGMLACIVVAGAVALGIDGIEADSRLGIPMALLIKTLVLLGLVGVLWWLVLARDERQRFVTWVRRRAQRTPT